MGYLEQFGFKIYRLRDAKAESEFLLYSLERENYSFYNDKRLYSILLMEFKHMKIDLVEFAREKLNFEGKIKPNDIIYGWVQDEIKLIDNIGYKPSDEKVFEEDGKYLFNTYKQSELSKLCKDVDHDKGFDNIKKLIMNLVGNNDLEYDYFIKWIAWQLQNPLKRLPTSIILQGEHGTGKTKFCELILKPLFEKNFCEIGQADINKEYNDYIMGKQLIVANEVIHNDNKFLVPDKLKNYVTDKYLSINRKFKDTIYIRNYSQWIFVTNNQVPLKVERGDRRYSVFQSKKLKNGSELIGNLIKNHDIELKSFISHLWNIDVDYDEVDKPIENQAKKDLIKASYNSVQEFYDFVTEELQGIDNLFDYCDIDVKFQIHNDDTYLVTNDFYKAYCYYCNDVGYKITSKTNFTRNLKQFRFHTGTKIVMGKSTRVLIFENE